MLNKNDQKINKANPEELKLIFLKYADKQIGDEKFISGDNFVKNFLKFEGLKDLDNENFNDPKSKRFLVRNLVKSGDLINFEEFSKFESLLCQWDALYLVLFKILDIQGNGAIKLSNFKSIIQSTELFQKFPFLNAVFKRVEERVQYEICDNENSSTSLSIQNYGELLDILNLLNEEIIHSSFQHFNEDGLNKGLNKLKSARKNESLSLENFKFIFNEILLKFNFVNLNENEEFSFFRENLENFKRKSSESESDKISYAEYKSIVNLLRNFNLLKLIHLHLTNQNKEKYLTQSHYLEYLSSNNFKEKVHPGEIKLLFNFINLLRLKVAQNEELEKIEHLNELNYFDLVFLNPNFNEKIPNQYYKNFIAFNKKKEDKATIQKDQNVIRSVHLQVLESVYRFTLGAFAGALGSTVVYPIDLVKTRIQNQRYTTSYVGELFYKSNWDCFKKVLRYEGFFGLYRGLIPQLLGVAPEKAIKLTTNDFMKDKLIGPNSSSRKSGDNFKTLLLEVLSGGCAGGSQVIFTNPIEIIKIRLQVSGELISLDKLNKDLNPSAHKVSAWNIIKELGIFGLYRGSSACFLRDIPFSAIYFPAYAHFKTLFQDKNGYNAPETLLIAGAIAGIPAASLVTPADVIKTRLQVTAREGQTTYNRGIIDAFKKILKEEGPSALWKGTVARVFRSSPQFGVTLLSYEILQRYFYIDFYNTGSRPIQPSKDYINEKDLIFNKNLPTTPPLLKENSDHIGGYSIILNLLNNLQNKFSYLSIIK